MKKWTTGTGTLPPKKCGRIRFIDLWIRRLVNKSSLTPFVQAWPWRPVALAIAAVLVIMFLFSMPAWAGAQINGTGQVFENYHIAVPCNTQTCPPVYVGYNCYTGDVWFPWYRCRRS